MKNILRSEVLKKLQKKKKSVLQPSLVKDSKLSSYWEATQKFVVIVKF